LNKNTTAVDTPQGFCHFGQARCDITPPVGIYHRMWGAALHDRAEGVHRELFEHPVGGQVGDDPAHLVGGETAGDPGELGDQPGHRVLAVHQQRELPLLGGEPQVAGAFTVLGRAQHDVVAAAGIDELDVLDPGAQDGPLLTGGTPETEIVSALAPRAADLIVPKHRWSAFHGTYLDLALRARKADTVILVGASTDVGIASTAFAARDLDYNLVIVEDACTSPEKDSHEQLMRRVFPRMGRVRSARQVVAMLA